MPGRDAVLVVSRDVLRQPVAVDGVETNDKQIRIVDFNPIVVDHIAAPRFSVAPQSLAVEPNLRARTFFRKLDGDARGIDPTFGNSDSATIPGSALAVIWDISRRSLA